jgi:hypothetical protein
MAVPDDVIDDVCRDAQAIAASLSTFSTMWGFNLPGLIKEATPEQLKRLHAALDIVEDATNQLQVLKD